MRHLSVTVGFSRIQFARSRTFALNSHFFPFQQTLFNILGDLGHYGNMVWKLNQFVDSIAFEATSPSSQQERLNENGTAGNIDGVCQTYQAFGVAISHVLQQFKRELVAMETDICAQCKKKKAMFFNMFRMCKYVLDFKTVIQKCVTR